MLYAYSIRQDFKSTAVYFRSCIGAGRGTGHVDVHLGPWRH